MHPGRSFVLFGAASAAVILSGSFVLHAYQAAAPKPNYDPPENLVRTDLPHGHILAAYVMKLTDEDIVDLSAYVASLQP